MQTWGIDVATHDAKRLMRELLKVKTNEHVESLGAYVNEPGVTMVHLTTEWTQSELDDWLYKTHHGCDYVGTFGVD